MDLPRGDDLTSTRQWPNLSGAAACYISPNVTAYDTKQAGGRLGASCSQMEGACLV